MDRPSKYSSLRSIGDYKPSARASDHNGWLLLDGRTIDRSSYPKLFEVLEVASATLVLPDGKDCLLVGAGGRLAVLERGGSNEITLHVENLPEHDHGFADTYAEPSHQKSGVLAGVVNLLSGLTTRTADRRTAAVGKGKPISIAPLAIGANLFIYAGEAMR